MKKGNAQSHMITYVSTGKVTTLKHELRDDAVEFAALVAETLLTGAKSTEVLCRLRDDIIIEVEIDPTRLGWMVISGQQDPAKAMAAQLCCEEAVTEGAELATYLEASLGLISSVVHMRLRYTQRRRKS